MVTLTRLCQLLAVDPSRLTYEDKVFHARALSLCDGMAGLLLDHWQQRPARDLDKVEQALQGLASELELIIVAIQEIESELGDSEEEEQAAHDIRTDVRFCREVLQRVVRILQQTKHSNDVCVLRSVRMPARMAREMPAWTERGMPAWMEIERQLGAWFSRTQ